MSIIKRGLKAFGRFWWEFLVGDTPELAVATLVIVGTALMLHHQRTAALIVLPLLVTAVISISSYRGRRRATDPPSRPHDGVTGS